MEGKAEEYVGGLLEMGEENPPARSVGDATEMRLDGELKEPTKPLLNSKGDRRGCGYMDGFVKPGAPAYDPRPYDGDTSKIHEARDENELPRTFRERYKNEKYEHRVIAYLRAQGLSLKAIAERLDYSPVTVGQICKLPWVQTAILEAIKEAGQDEVRTLLQASALESIQTLIDIRNDPKARNADRISSARELLDRQYGRAAQLTVHATTRDLEQLSDDELTKLARGSINN